MARLDRCRYPKCRNEVEIIYLDRPLCWKHWQMIDERPDLLRKKIGLPPMERPKPKPVSKFSIFTGRVRVRRKH